MKWQIDIMMRDGAANMSKEKYFIFKDKDGYFIGKLGSNIYKKITYKEYEYYKLHLPEAEIIFEEAKRLVR